MRTVEEELAAGLLDAPRDPQHDLVPYNIHSNAYANALVVKAGAGLLYGFTVYSSKGSGQFIQWHDLNAVPAAGAIPAGFITIATVSDRELAWLPARSFEVGIVLVNSTTGPTYTAGSADCFFDAQYR